MVAVVVVVVVVNLLLVWYAGSSTFSLLSTVFPLAVTSVHCWRGRGEDRTHDRCGTYVKQSDARV